MVHPNGTAIQAPEGGRKAFLFALLFVIVAAAGLTYVKWWPYYHKALKAIAEHTIGSSSLITGTAATAPEPSWSAAWDFAAAYYKSVWKAAVLGILIGSLVQVLLPSKWLLRVLGSGTFKSTALGGLAAIPGMMCTCCAAPIAVGMRKKNVSAGAAMAFWLGNPLINPATLIFMTFVLSWKFTVIRLVFGLLLTFGVGYWTNRLAGDKQIAKETVEKSVPDEHREAPVMLRWLISVWSMILHLVPAYIIAVFALGAVRAWLFPSLGEGAAEGILTLVIFAIAGALFVIPTAAEIPIIQTFLSFGFGTSTAAALLITLPALSLPSMLMIGKSFPRRAVWSVFAAVVVTGLVSGIVGHFIL